MEIKTVNDYYEDVRKLWPRLPKKDIMRILNYGFRSLYLHNSYGGDTLIKDKDFLCYIGYLRNNSIKHFEYYIKKLIIKIRVLYKRRKFKWDGYYYFALTNTQIEKYLSQKKSRGRPRKWFDYGQIMLYKIKDECSLREHNCKYIFKVPYKSDIGMKSLQRNFRSKEAELIEVREPLKFEDILVTNHKYEVLNEKGNN